GRGPRDRLQRGVRRHRLVERDGDRGRDPAAPGRGRVSASMSRALICSHRPMDELQQTLIAREDVARYHTDDWRDALSAARHLPVDVLFVDAETPGARDLVREMRSEPLTRHIALAVLARRGAK